MKSKRTQTQKYQYNEEIFSFYPAPALEVVVAESRERKRERFSIGLLDTGSDITVVPSSVIEELGLQPIDIGQFAVAEGKRPDEKIYKLYLSIDNHWNDYVDVIARDILEKLNYILIGRDILNKWSLLLKGRNKIFEIS